MEFASLDAVRSACASLPAGNDRAASAAHAHQGRLTKPPGSLGALEHWTRWLAQWQGRIHPRLDRVQILVFAGNHGIAERGVSAWPAAVTAQMVANFAAGGAAINQLARLIGATLQVVPLQLDQPTADFTIAPALDGADILAAINAGADCVALDCDLVVIGEMGIANTTAAAALCAALLGGKGGEWAGRGTGVDDHGLKRKIDVIDAGLARHRGLLNDPLAVATALGGRELAAMMGAVLAARLRRVPVLLDGFVSTAAVLPLQRLAADALAHCQAGHVSAEQGHRRLLARLGLAPMLDLGLRLGEASGAALAVPLLRAALACHDGMATFDQAGVSERT